MHSYRNFRRLCMNMDRYVIKSPWPSATQKSEDTVPKKKLKTYSMATSSALSAGGKDETDSAISNRTSAGGSDEPDSAIASGTSAGVCDERDSVVTSGKKGFHLKHINGDLFKSPANQSLAHCISEDVNMGKGIATIFKKQFGGVEELKSQGVKPGGVAVLERDERYIYYLVTKEKYWQKPTYNSLQSTLEAMVAHCQCNDVTRVSMPRIGCGLDGLKWPTVEDIIRLVFKDTDMTVTVYSLDEKNKPRGRGGPRGRGRKKAFQK